MKRFEPDYTQLVEAAYNREADRLPLYEHGFDSGVVEKIISEPVVPLLSGSYTDKVEALRRIARCGLQLGYDCIPFERSMVSLVQNGQGLMGHLPAIIKTMDDVEAYPWDRKRDEYARRFDEDFAALREALPEGMKAVGGIGFGLFETLQDFVPFQDLAFLQIDEPEVYEVLWSRIVGIEMDIMTSGTPEEVNAYVRKLLPKIEGRGGIAIGTGNQISSYTEPANWIAMCEAVREWRGA